jgi:FkbM family methyltransferase
VSIPFHLGAWLRRGAQSIRHARGLRGCESLWNPLRKPYGQVLRILSGGRGLPLKIGGYTVRLDPLVANLNWETVEVEAYRAFAACVQPGDVVYDVGAHFGTYTLIALRKGGPRSRVVAYEPCELTRDYLMRHLFWNWGAEQVTVRPLCCGATRGRARFFYRPGVPEGINGLVEAGGLEATWIDVTTLDDEVATLNLIPAIIKIDVEGAELDVLKGAEGVLSAHRPRLFLSLHPGPLAKLGLTPGAIAEWLVDRRYRCQYISEDQEIHVMAVPFRSL